MTITTNRREWRMTIDGDLTVITGTGEGRPTIKYGRDSSGWFYKLSKRGNWAAISSDVPDHDDHVRTATLLFCAFDTIEAHD